MVAVVFLLTAQQASAATTRFASPTGAGVAPCTSQGTPCPLESAVEIVAVAGDTVLLLPGSYSLGVASLAVSSITVQPRDPGTRVTIDGGGASVVTASGTATLRDLKITETNAPGSNATLILLGPSVLAERIAVETSTTNSNQRACSVVDSTLRDSSCMLTLSGGPIPGVALSETSNVAASHTANLVNVTAWGQVSGGAVVTGLLGSTTGANVQVTILARNVIAQGAGGGSDVLHPRMTPRGTPP